MPCRNRTYESFAAPIRGVVIVAIIRIFDDHWSQKTVLEGDLHASTTVGGGFTLYDHIIALHGASFDDRLRHERLRRIQASNLAGVPIPRKWPGFLTARALCALHMHASEFRRWISLRRW
jgi:hypothetical protein